MRLFAIAFAFALAVLPIGGRAQTADPLELKDEIATLDKAAADLVSKCDHLRDDLLGAPKNEIGFLDLGKEVVRWTRANAKMMLALLKLGRLGMIKTKDQVEELDTFFPTEMALIHALGFDLTDRQGSGQPDVELTPSQFDKYFSMLDGGRRKAEAEAKACAAQLAWIDKVRADAKAQLAALPPPGRPPATPAAPCPRAKDGDHTGAWVGNGAMFTGEAAAEIKAGKKLSFVSSTITNPATGAVEQMCRCSRAVVGESGNTPGNLTLVVLMGPEEPCDRFQQAAGAGGGMLRLVDTTTNIAEVAKRIPNWAAVVPGFSAGATSFTVKPRPDEDNPGYGGPIAGSFLLTWTRPPAEIRDGDTVSITLTTQITKEPKSFSGANLQLRTADGTFYHLAMTDDKGKAAAPPMIDMFVGKASNGTLIEGRTWTVTLKPVGIGAIKDLTHDYWISVGTPNPGVYVTYHYHKINAGTGIR